MGRINRHQPVKLITSLFFKEEEIFKDSKKTLIRRFGVTDFESRSIPFTHTDYYEKEFGRHLARRFLSFKRLIRPEELPGIKVFTNKIESKSSKEACRRINIDPGYINLAKLVLATAKDYGHRTYLGKGIFAEVTLFYREGSFRPWEWTYPDYKTPESIGIFNRIRATYAQQSCTLRT
ncbi:DUF4416 family protein [Candidatus Omnitrophota bacterium]